MEWRAQIYDTLQGRGGTGNEYQPFHYSNGTNNGALHIPYMITTYALSILIHEAPTVCNQPNHVRFLIQGNFEMTPLFAPRTKMEKYKEDELRLSFRFRRSHLGYIVQSIGPSIMIVLASFGSLWVPANMVFDR